MAEIDEVQNEIVKPATLKQCRHCSEEIKESARVCHHCSRVQTGFFRFSNVIRIAEGMALLVSLGLLAVAFLNWSSTQDQLTQAREARAQAEAASKRVELVELKVTAAFDNIFTMERQVLAARSDVLEIAQAMSEVAEILSHSGELAGGGLGETNKALLKRRLERLRDKLDESGSR
jgi:hypothetical protein